MKRSIIMNARGGNNVTLKSLFHDPNGRPNYIHTYQCSLVRRSLVSLALDSQLKYNTLALLYI
jgi:hypothetical protein